MITINNETYDGVMIKPSLDDALAHYGVKGMKWRKHLKSLGTKLKKELKFKGYRGNLSDRGFSSSKSGERNGAVKAEYYSRLKRNFGRNLSKRGYDMSKHATVSGYAGRDLEKPNKSYSFRDQQKDLKKGANSYYYYNAGRALEGTAAGRKRAKKKGYKVK